MKKIRYNTIHGVLLVLLALTGMMMTSCAKDASSAPVIDAVRNYAASPNDTIVNSVKTGQWIVLQGANLSGVSMVTFCGVPATIKSGLFADNSLVVEIPEIAYQNVAPADLNVIQVMNGAGSTAYKIDIIGKPLITHVRNFAAAPNDTILTSILPGQTINIVGFNLKNPTSISFQGVKADLSVVQYTDSSAIVQVPADLAGGDASLVNTISYTSNVGTGAYAIKIYGPPVILTISHELPSAGETVYVYGSNLSNASSFSFAGVAITSFTVSAAGTTISFVAPALTQPGPVVVTTPGGTFTTAYNVNDAVSNIISNFEWGIGFQWEWWGGATLASGDPASGWPAYDSRFPGDKSLFLILDVPNKLGIGKDDSGNSGTTSIRIPIIKDPSTNVLYPCAPLANLSDPAASWAFKFEVNIPNDWNGSSLCIVSDNTNFMARLEPWQISATKTAAFKTNGWETVTVPLTVFRSADPTLGAGRGNSVTTLSSLLSTTGQTHWQVYLHNYGTTETKTTFLGAFDNFRLVKR